MKRENIISLLSACTKSSLVIDSLKFILSDSTLLLSENPGKYSVEELLADLNIRAKTCKDAGINPIGMFELKNNLETFSEDQIVQNYIFKNERKTCIVYLDKTSKILIGTLMINSANKKSGL